MSELNIRSFDGAGADPAIEDALAVRHTVFVEGQNVPLEREHDGLDIEATHYVGYLSSSPIAVARVRLLHPHNRFGTDAKIERVGVVAGNRHRGYGDAIMARLLGDMEADQRIKDAVLDSQLDAMEFYRRLGFIPVGETFEDAGILHRKMTRTIHAG